MEVTKKEVSLLVKATIKRLHEEIVNDGTISLYCLIDYIDDLKRYVDFLSK